MFINTNKPRKPRFYKRKGFWIFGVLCLVIAGIALAVIDSKLDPYREIANTYELERIGEVEVPSIIMDRKGREIGRMFVENRSKIPLDKVPPVFIDAMIAQEDQRFYEHDGVDWVGVARAAYLNVKSGGVTQGAGTVTMQLGRNAFDLLGEAKRNEWSGYERKIIEAFLALRIEEDFHKAFESEYPNPVTRKKVVKDLILEYYLNRVPFGAGYYGVRSASLGYFGKEPVELNIEECASIVACLKNPARLNPLRYPQNNKAARDHVLRRMALEGMITEADRDRMLKMPIVLNPKPILRGKSYLYELIAGRARDLVGEEALSRGGYTIHTTIDLDVQNTAERMLKDQLDQIEQTPEYVHPKYPDYSREISKNGPEYLQGAVMMLDHGSGEIIAHVGGRDYRHSQYDFVELGRRPLGTAFFPFIYASAFEQGMTPASSLLDEQLNNRQLMVGGTEGVVGEWGMEVTSPQYEGKITARRSLNASKIGSTVRLGVDLGLSSVAATAQSFGLPMNEGRLLNRMLVGWDAVSLPEATLAYSSFPRGGSRPSETFYIREIRDIENQAVFTSEHLNTGPDSSKACSDASAFQIHSILNDVTRSGNLGKVSGGLSEKPFFGGVKTGTPYGLTDAWAIGYNSRVTCTVWVGFHQGSRKAITPQGFAKDIAYPVWQETMNAALPDFCGERIMPPDSILEIPACRISGMRPTRYCNEAIENLKNGQLTFRSTSYQEYFRKGEQMGICSFHGSGVSQQSQVIERTLPVKALPIAPIRSKAPLLLGFDPFNSEKPNLAPEDTSSEVFLRQRNTLVVQDQVKGERAALLRLPRPPRFELPVETPPQSE